MSETKLEALEGATLDQKRDLKTVTTEIRTLHRQAQQMVLSYAIEIGRRLVEAKALVEHGDWGRYIKEELGYSQSTANNFMRLFEEYGAKQQSIFGAEANSQTFGNLTYSQALALLALPAEEREEFVDGHPVEEMSTRELARYIQERNEAIKEKNAAQEAQQEAEDQIVKLTEELDALKVQHIDVPVAQADPETVQKEVAAAVAAEREKAKGEADKLSAKLDKAKAERAELEAKLRAAENKATAAADKDNAEVEELRRQLAMADPVTAEFKGLFAQASTLAARLLELAAKAPEDKRDNLRAALEALGRQLTGEAAQ